MDSHSGATQGRGVGSPTTSVEIGRNIGKTTKIGILSVFVICPIPAIITVTQKQ
jgi:hypothetical protein